MLDSANCTASRPGGYGGMAFPIGKIVSSPQQPWVPQGSCFCLLTSGWVGRRARGAAKGLTPPQPPHAAFHSKGGAVPLPVFTGKKKKIKGHFLHWLPGLESTEVSKATVSQTLSQEVAWVYCKVKACTFMTGSTSFASARGDHSCRSDASSPFFLPSIQLHETARLTADPSGEKPTKLISSFEMVTGNCR